MNLDIVSTNSLIVTASFSFIILSIRPQNEDSDGAWFFVALIKLCKHIIYNVMSYVNNTYDEMLYKLD